MAWNNRILRTDQSTACRSPEYAPPGQKTRHGHRQEIRAWEAPHCEPRTTQRRRIQPRLSRPRTIATPGQSFSVRFFFAGPSCYRSTSARRQKTVKNSPWLATVVLTRHVAAYQCLWLVSLSWGGKTVFISRLFKGDRALEACLLHNWAHVTPGSVGEHVGKIQKALVALEKAAIDTEERAETRYGSSTAGGVLAYKRKRRIINRAYQTQADNIVGKMTIAALDKEMFQYELRNRRRCGCGDPPGGRRMGVPVPQSLPASRIAAAKQFPANLNILWQPTQGGLNEAGNKHLVYVARALEILKPFGMNIISSVASIPDGPIPHEMSVNPGQKDEVETLRKAAEKQRPGATDVLRFIVCPLDRVRVDGHFEIHVADTVGGEPGGWPFFVLINARLVHPDHATALHEMIHAATGKTKEQHDDDPDSIFALGSAEHPRTVLKEDDAKALSESFFHRAK
jgi:hypothetical protein